MVDVGLCGLTLFTLCADNCVRVASESHSNRALSISGEKREWGMETDTRLADSNYLIAEDKCLKEWKSEEKREGRNTWNALSVLEKRTKDWSEMKRGAALHRLLLTEKQRTTKKSDSSVLSNPSIS